MKAQKEKKNKRLKVICAECTTKIARKFALTVTT
jgi:hypothetical protein